MNGLRILRWNNQVPCILFGCFACTTLHSYLVYICVITSIHCPMKQHPIKRYKGLSTGWSVVKNGENVFLCIHHHKIDTRLSSCVFCNICLDWSIRYFQSKKMLDIFCCRFLHLNSSMFGKIVWQDIETGADGTDRTWFGLWKAPEFLTLWIALMPCRTF